MKTVKRVFLSFFTIVGLLCLWSSRSSALSINFSNPDIEGGFPGPPKTKIIKDAVVELNDLDANAPKLFNICDFDGALEHVHSDLIELKVVHRLFKSEEVVSGVKYQVHISRKDEGPPIEFAIRTSIPSKLSTDLSKSESNICDTDTYTIHPKTSEAVFNWTLKADNKQSYSNVSIRINYKLKDNPTIYRAIFTYSISQECHLYLHPETTNLSNTDIPKSTDCRIWFPSPNDGHGLVVELIRLNVPCTKGYIHFAGTNQTHLPHGRTFHKLCGKLEELPEPERSIYFPETSKTQPYMDVHGSPTFSVSYRLVDYCYNITFIDKEGTVDLKPTGELKCTFRIYMPYGNRVAVKLQIGDSTVKESSDTFLNFQDLKTGNTPCKNGLLTQLHDGDFRWSHCTQKGDQERQIEIVSKDNKIVLKVTRRAETSPSGGALRLRMSYRAEPIQEVVGMCEFRWVAMRQFCVTVLDGAKLPWAMAEAECVKRGGHLVSVRSELDQKIVDNLLTNSPGYRNNNVYWIGASDKTHESDFRWSDGLTFTYTNWFPGWPQHQHYNKQPNDDGLSEQDCVEVRRTYTLPSTSVSLAPGFMWNDRDCATPNYFICEKLQNDEPLEDNWPSDCNRTMALSRQTPRASISSLGFPRHYPDNADCDTNIIAPSGYRIVLDFDELVIENEPSCSYDYLEIIEHAANHSTSNTSSFGRRLCGDWSTKLKLLRYVSQGSRLTLRFSSDYSHHFGGYKARVSMENAMQCGDDRLHMFNDACYLVVNYPEVTWPTAQQICRGMKAQLASIVTPEEARFITSIIRKNSEYRTSALYWLGGKADPATDFKWIDGSAMDFQGWLPGEKPTENDLVETGNEPRCIGVQWKPSPTPLLPSGLYWKSQRCSQVGGYVCKRKRLLLDAGIDFNKTINSSEGTLTTPNYPENYYNNLDFLVKIIGPERTRLKIRFSKIDIESQLECLYDYVELKSSGSKDRRRKKLQEDGVKLCGSHGTQMARFDFVSQTNEAEVTFHSDYSVGGSGFSLTWEAVDVSACPIQTLTAREGVITSPNYPDFLLAHLDCSIVIQAPLGKRIWLEFTDVDLGGLKKTDPINNENQEDVTLELQLGKKSDSFKPFQMDELLTEGNFISLGQFLRIKLRTGTNPEGRGFRASYRTSAEAAIEEKIIMLKNDSSGSLLHLNYPKQSPPRLDFLQRFIAPPGYIISMELHSMRLTHKECDVDGSGLVEVFDSYSDANGTLWRLCHQSLEERDEDFHFSSPAIHIKSFLNTIQLRQKSGTLGNPLNGSLRVLPDEGYRKKLINYGHKDVESCMPNPCQHGGKCTNKKSRKICQCIGHYTGLFCAITQCDLEPCVFGTCELTDSSYKCHCKTGYLGPTCEQKKKPCEGNPCESRGTCIEKGNGFQCRCHAWWEGLRCEKRMLHIPYKPLSERMLHEPFWLGLMTVFVVMAVIGLVWCAKRHFPEKIEKLLAEDDNRNRIHSLRSTSVREQLAAASGGSAVALAATAASPGPAPGRSLFGRLGIRKPSILSLTSPHASGAGGYSPATARTFSLDDLLKPPPRRSPSPKKKRNNSTPTKKNAAEKKQILQQLISPVNKHTSKRVSLGELIQMTEQRDNGIQSAPSVIVRETKFCDDPALTALNDPKLEKKVTFARLLNKVSAEMSSGSEMEMGIMRSNRLGCIFPRPSSTPPSPGVVNRSPNSTSSNQGSDSFTSSDLAIPSALSSSISDLLINRRQGGKTTVGRQKPASADSILAMFRNFSSSSAGANLPSSLKLTPSTTPTASSPHDDIVGDDESSSSSVHTPVSFSSGCPESPILHHHHSYSQSTIEVPVLDPLSAHRSSVNGNNLLHPPTILLEIPSTINKCLSPIRELPTPLPSPMPSPAITPIMRRNQSPLGQRYGQISASSLEEMENSDDRISVEIPNISISASDDEDVRCPDIVIDPQAEDGLIFEEAAAMQHSALYKTKNRPPPLGQINDRDSGPHPAPPLVIPTLIIETPSPTRKSANPLIPGSPPPHRSFPHHPESAFQFPTTTKMSGRKMFKDFDKPTSLDLPSAPPMITITCNMSEAESDIESISPAVKLSGHHGPSGGMTYLSPFSMAHRGEQHASESNLSSSGYSSMASPGPSRCGSSNPLCPSEMEDQGPPGSGNHGLRRQSLTPVLRPNSSSGNNEPKTNQEDQRRGRSDSETLSDDPLLESNDEGIGTDHIDEKIDEGEVKSAKELEIFMTVDTISDNKIGLLDLPLIPSLTTPRVAKCVSIESSMDRLVPPLTGSSSKNSLQLPSIVVQMDAATGEKYLSPMSSRSESPLSDRTTGMGRFSPLFYGKNKDLLPFTDSDGLYDFPSSDKVNVATACQHKKVGRKREKRGLRSCKTPSPTKQQQNVTWHNHLDVPSVKDPYYKVPPPRKLSPKRRLARTQIVSSSSSSDSIASTRELRPASSSSPSPDTIRWSPPVGWVDQKHPKSLDASAEDKDDSNPSSPMLSRSLEFTRKQPKYPKISRLRAISNQIRFLRRLEQSLKRRERTASPASDSEEEDDNPMVTSPLLHQSKEPKVEIIRKSSSIGKLQANAGLAAGKTNRGTKYKQCDSLQERCWPREVMTKHGNSE